MRRRFITLDVFTRSRFSGNPLALVLDAQGLETAAMQTIAREFSHPETVFVLPPVNAAHKASLRIFTPAAELPFAGHPTVGAAVGLARLAGGAAAQSFVLEEKIGPVSCIAQAHDADSGRAEFQLPRLPADVGNVPDVRAMARALGLAESDIGGDYPPARWSAGVAYTFVPVRSLTAVARARPDPATFEIVFGIGGPAMVYVMCTETAEPNRHLHARMFAPGNGIPEDPATGSAVAAFAGLHAMHRRPADGEHRLAIEQGYEMGRPSLMNLTLTMVRGALTAASIGGDAIVVTEGVIEA
jgi:trans-2,3-dihydro-3-hydroxyanthranilate isomerase